MRRPFFMFAGTAMLGLGAAGTLLPILPATPFLLIAAWCFSHSSPRLERWLFTHPVFGPQLRDWREHRAIGGRTKCIALACIVVSYVATVVTLWSNTRALCAVTLILAACTIFIATRPSPPAGED